MKDIFFTFDMDWSVDEVLEDFLCLIKECQIKATIHITNQTGFIDKFRNDDDIEMGIHPNFNCGLQGEGGHDAEKIMEEMKLIVPEAVCCRSHALTTSSLIVALYDKYGIKYDLNHIIEPAAGMRLLPWQVQCGEAKALPFIFEDDVYISCGQRKPVNFYLGNEFEAPRIFNFHPQHLFLNTPSLEWYNQTKPYYKEYSQLKKFRNTKERGIRDIFKELVAFAKKNGYTFKTISEGEW